MAFESISSIIRNATNWEKKYKELEKVFHTEAMAADRRMLRIERDYSKRKGYEGITNFSYAKAQRDIEAWTKRELNRGTISPKRADDLLKKKRFDRAIKNAEQNYYEAYRELSAKLNDVRDFLRSDSSTLKGSKSPKASYKSEGVENIYKKRADTLSKTLDEDIEWQDLASIFESKQWKLSEKYSMDSKTRIKAVQKVKEMPRTKQQMAEFLKDKENVNIDPKKMKREELVDLILKADLSGEDDAILSDVIKKLLKEGVGKWFMYGA